MPNNIFDPKGPAPHLIGIKGDKGEPGVSGPPGVPGAPVSEIDELYVRFFSNTFKFVIRVIVYYILLV